MLREGVVFVHQMLDATDVCVRMHTRCVEQRFLVVMQTRTGCNSNVTTHSGGCRPRLQRGTFFPVAGDGYVVCAEHHETGVVVLLVVMSMLVHACSTHVLSADEHGGCQTPD